ncbi:MAG TPA: transposase, partial [Tenuifilaceae bacterium]|nr:transposase [Tenuifilaceae bacterium]
IAAEEVALIYRYRWTIETTFKKIKQNFQLHFQLALIEIKHKVPCKSQKLSPKKKLLLQY